MIAMKARNKSVSVRVSVAVKKLTTTATLTKEDIQLGWLAYSPVSSWWGAGQCVGRCGPGGVAESPTFCRQQEVS